MTWTEILDIYYGVVMNSGGPMNTNPMKVTTRPVMIRHRGIFCGCWTRQRVELDGRQSEVSLSKLQQHGTSSVTK